MKGSGTYEHQQRTLLLSTKNVVKFSGLSESNQVK